MVIMIDNNFNMKNFFEKYNAEEKARKENVVNGIKNGCEKCSRWDEYWGCNKCKSI